MEKIPGVPVVIVEILSNLKFASMWEKHFKFTLQKVNLKIYGGYFSNLIKLYFFT